MTQRYSRNDLTRAQYKTHITETLLKSAEFRKTKPRIRDALLYTTKI